MDVSHEPEVILTPLEQRFEAIRARLGLLLAPTLFAWILASDLPSLSPEAHRLAAVMAAVVALWITEALPMPVTALLGAGACVVLRVAPAKDVFSPFADQIMFLFIGSFILARAIFLHRLDRRLAFGVLSLGWVGARPGRILFAFGACTAFTSAWISNTATTAMMFAIGLSIFRFLKENERFGGSPVSSRYATALMLMTSFSASIGGLATPIGTPPNLIGLSAIRRLGADITFLQWSAIGTPVVVALFLFLFAYMHFLCPAGVREFDGCHAMLRRQKDELGRWTRGQVSTVIALVVTVALWVAPSVVGLALGTDSEQYKLVNASLPEALGALAGAGLLFLLPGEPGRKVITWKQAAEIDWGVVLLYGGGVALGGLANSTKLAEAVGLAITDRLPSGTGEFGILVAATLVATLVSEVTSNTASATIVVPVVIALAQAAGVDPVPPAVAATMASSLGFMLPVSTPCNAIVYGSGLIPLTRMIRYGVLLDVAGAITIVVLVPLLLPLIR
jgi:sodium-dependent dicarboxylate transporter 2/3/5